MSTRLIKPTDGQRLEIRCDVADALVANLAWHLAFFFPRHLDPEALRRAFATALTSLPIFAGRLGMDRGGMRIRCDGRGVPFTVVSSDRTLHDAIRSVSMDTGLWLLDPVHGATARWGWGPVCKVRVTHLADEATAIGFSWHHMIGDLQTAMHLMNAWAAAAAGRPLPEPLIARDRAAYLDEHLPADGASQPGVRCLRPGELVRSALYLATDARKQRTVSCYFSDDEIARMRTDYGTRMLLSTNDVVCGHLCEALMNSDPAVDRRSLGMAVNVRKRCGLDPMLIGNIITTLNVDLHRGEGAQVIAERIRHRMDRFAGEHCDMRINQRLFDAAGAWRSAWFASTAFNPAQWNPIITNQSGFGVYRIEFEAARACYCTPLLKLPVAGGGVLMEGAGGRGLVFQMALPPREFEVMSRPAVREHLHRFRCAGDDIPRVHREIRG